MVRYKSVRISIILSCHVPGLVVPCCTLDSLAGFKIIEFCWFCFKTVDIYEVQLEDLQLGLLCTPFCLDLLCVCLRVRSVTAIAKQTHKLLKTHSRFALCPKQTHAM